MLRLSATVGTAICPPVSLMSRRGRRRTVAREPQPAIIESLNHDGRGVARIDGKVVFIRGALPGEEVMFIPRHNRKNYGEGDCIEVIKASVDRVEPHCQHFGVCGGCSLQHMKSEAQIHAKQQIMLENLHYLGKVEPEKVLDPLTGPYWGYRRKARLGVKYVFKKDSVLVGFRERSSSYLADIHDCKILYPAVGEDLLELRKVMMELSARERIPQIEMAVGDDDSVALVLRTLERLGEGDRLLLKEFAEKKGFQIYLQTKGPDTVTPLYPERAHLSYRLPEFDLELFFTPLDFTQINAAINRKMVDLAVKMLDPQPDERILDLFCGLGNFSLPLARKAGFVVGVEGDAGLVERARHNAKHNGITNIEFFSADLADDPQQYDWFTGRFDKLLIDPARAGAAEVISHLAKLEVCRIVYVSCNPATLARDAGEIVNRYGYKLVSVGVMDMFPHTTHVESIALFEKK